jgi:hypothetical protein
MRLEDDFRFNLQGQLSHDKTEIDVAIASKIAREFAVSFSVFVAENYALKRVLNKPIIWEGKQNKNYTTKELLKIYEDGL